MVSFVAKNTSELQLIADQLVEIIKKRPVVAFYGKMGAGKTTLIKEICKSLEVINLVTSPTFALVNEYKTRHGQSLYHFDFYRVNKLEEIYDMGYDEYFYSGNYCFIEWPELAEGLLLPDTLIIKIEVDEKQYRHITVEENLLL